MRINPNLKKCKKIFNSKVDNVSINEQTIQPIFEKEIECPSCDKTFHT
jgi:hypothetical protein